MYCTIDSISPNAKPWDTFVQSGSAGFPVWIYPAAAAIIFIILYVILSVSISGSATEVNDFIKSVIS